MQRAALVISGHYTDEKASALAWRLASEHAPDTANAVAWSLRTSLPGWLRVDLRDQLEAHHRDAEEAGYLLVWFGTEDEVAKLDVDAP